MTDWIGTFLPEILGETSPELAIKLAYDYGRDVRQGGAAADELARLLGQRIDLPFKDSPLLRYVRIGFSAGFEGEALPRRRHIDESSGK
jgi:hypothetical protein